MGLLEMFKVGRIDINEGNIPDAHKVAFQISPRINAAGRMDHASTSFKLMTEGDRVKARSLALEVEEANQNRQKITAEIVRETRALAENSFKDKKLIFAYNENWRVGILGLIAGKIADEFQKPTAIFQKQDSEFVGSLRSIHQLNIIEALEKCSGVRLAHDKMEEFYARLSEIVEKELKGKEAIPEIEIDMKIGMEEISWEMMADLKRMEPFGEGNAEPVFLTEDVIIEDARVVGNGSKHLKLSLRSKDGGPKVFDAIGFRLGESFSGLKSGDLVDTVFNLQEDEWNGNKKLQINIIDLKLKKIK
jgi:single-stranded-DNA-specific exonuclease